MSTTQAIRRVLLRGVQTASRQWGGSGGRQRRAKPSIARSPSGVAEAGLALKFDEKSTHADVAMQVWLSAPKLLEAKHNELQLRRLSTFEYFGCKTPVDRKATFIQPTDETLALIRLDLEEWFPAHNRGRLTTQIEVKAIDGEFWFLIRHGDTFARKPKIENSKTEVLHYRPAVGDVVVYSPDLDEIRIHARTKGEKDLYRTTFGNRLFGDDEYFSERKAYSLEPLRKDGVDALEPDGVEGLQRVVLKEVEWVWDNEHQEIEIHKAADLFAARADSDPDRPLIPSGVRLRKGTWDFHFEGAAKPRRVELRPPNILKLGRRCDVRTVQRWISARGFRVNSGAPTAGTSPQAEVAAEPVGQNLLPATVGAL